MNQALLLVTFLGWMLLSLLFMGWASRPSPLRKGVSLLAALIVLLLPIQGWLLCQHIATFIPPPSITFILLIAVVLIGRLGGPRLLRFCDWIAAWLFGALAALLLYPMGIGITPIDPYGWGWGMYVILATGIVAAVWIIAGNRFGVVLLLALSFLFFPSEPFRNSWNALIDPIYALVAFIALMTVGIRRLRNRPRGNR